MAPLPRWMLWLHLLILLLTFVLVKGSQPIDSNSRRLMFHREEPKLKNLNGPCSTMLIVGPEVSLTELGHVVGERLGIDVKRFSLDGKKVLDENLASLPSGTLLSVFESDEEGLTKDDTKRNAGSEESKDISRPAEQESVNAGGIDCLTNVAEPSCRAASVS
eukprot:TRINITY_DN27706_c0_g1_i1.p1 TRINITY_DN27706_c0_g1~~TRINITY_DN27706_c0_g1_i1.p1  ORF type:complete len:186 (+),score=28.36 TRINITY_DN27706_c0_g1_i1:74-559(+)